MEEAVGYPSIDCSQQTAAENALVLKHGRLFMLVGPHGNISPAGHCGLGLFHDDTRILSHYDLRLAGGPASLLSGQVSRMHHAYIDLAISSEGFGGRRWDASNAIHVRRELVLGDRLMERLRITSYLDRPVEYQAALHVGSDFADLFEVRGWTRPERGQFYAPSVSDDGISFCYRGRDGQLLRSAIRFHSPPSEVDAAQVTWRMRLQPHQPWEARWEVSPPGFDADTADTADTLERTRLLIDQGYVRWEDECTRWTTDVEDFNTTLRQATDDLRALYIEEEGEPIITAGIPWYTTAFGRDSIITSLQALPLNPDIARDTLRYLARHQGRKVDPFTEEQPGRIMHELRRGEMARNGEVPHLPYYGTIDATPLWLVLLHETWRWTGDQGLVGELLPNAERALEWMDGHGDLDGDGLLEYARTSEDGLVNQGWKDSWDGVPFPDGRLPEPPIALVEVQGYAYDARIRMAELLRVFGRNEEADRLRVRAAEVRQKILDRFWLDDLGTFALALDRDKRPVPSATTNAGHLLWSRVPRQDHADRMAEHFLDDAMFSGWGLRTLSARHAVYNPMSYHDGSIWPHDNALVVLGMCLYGHSERALPVISALHEAATAMPYHRLPELFCGMPRRHAPGPVRYPVSCSPQAWASGAFFMLLQGALGLLPHAPSGVLHLREPRLPPFLRKLRLDGLRVGGSVLSLQFRRHGKRTLANLMDTQGDPIDVRIALS